MLQFIRDMQIRNKLFLLSSVFFVSFLMLIAGGFYFINSVKVGSKSYNNIENYREILENIALLKSDLNEIKGILLSLQIESDKDKIVQLQERLKEVSSDADTYFSEIGVQASDEQIAAIIADAQTTWQEFVGTRDNELIPLILAGNKGKVKDLTEGIQQQRYKRFIEQVGSAVDILKMKIDDLKLIVDKSVRNNSLLIAGVTLLLFGFVAYFALLITGSISKPLNLVITKAKAIGNGALTQELIEITSKDEIGELGQVFNKMVARLGKLAQRAEIIASGIVGADEVEAKINAGMNFETAAAASGEDVEGDLENAFNKMQTQLRKLTIQARKIAADDLYSPVLDLKIQGELGGAFYQMTSVLRNLADVAKRISDGDLTVKIDTHSDKDVLANAFLQMVINLKALLNNVKEQTNLVANYSRGLSEISEQSTQTISQLTSTISQISTATASVAHGSQTASSTARDTDAAGRKGQELVAKLVEKITMIRLVSETSGNAMNSLSRQSAQIGEIVSVITKIADQTNLLSLNAAIEAARAGDAGRGFAVVADEVRKLAESSADSARKIAKIINEVQIETMNAVQSVNNGQKGIEEGVVLTQDASSRFSDIVAQVGNIVSQIEQIASSSEETAASAEESSASSEEQAASIEEISAAAGQLAGSVKVLQKSMEKFNI